MEPLVSVIVPIYNVKNYMWHSIESILGQTYLNFELLLVDDGSMDGSSELCDYYAKNDFRITVIHKSNGGLSSARNAGLNIAKGDYVLMIDGDDYIHSRALEELVGIITEFNADVVQFRYKEVEQNEVIVESNITPSIKECTDNKKIFEKLYEVGGEAASACTKLYNSILFDDLRYKEGIIHEDELMITHLLSRVKKIVYYDKQLYYYVKRSDSIIHNVFSLKRLDSLYVIEDRISFLKQQHYNDLLDKEYSRYFITMVVLYADAKLSNCTKACEIILPKLKIVLPTVKKSTYLSGKFRCLLRMLLINIRFIELYYLYKKLVVERRYNNV